MSQYPPIQVVNEHNEPIGGASMQKVYKQGLRHRTVHVIVKDQEGNITLQKRSGSVTTNPNRWDVSVGGHVDEHEEYIEAARRELQEELGLKNLELVELGTFYADTLVNDYVLKRFVKVYGVTITHDTPITFPPDEVTAVKWMSAAEIRQLITKHPDQVADGLIECQKFY
jgi:isopentenyldiphosphate isomerase